MVPPTALQVALMFLPSSARDRLHLSRDSQTAVISSDAVVKTQHTTAPGVAMISIRGGLSLLHNGFRCPQFLAKHARHMTWTLLSSVQTVATALLRVAMAVGVFRSSRQICSSRLRRCLHLVEADCLTTLSSTHGGDRLEGVVVLMPGYAALSCPCVCACLHVKAWSSPPASRTRKSNQYGGR